MAGQAAVAPGRIAGLGLAVAAAALWALGGVAAQELFAHYGVAPGWLVGVRLLAGGSLLLAVWRPPWPGRHAVPLIAIAVLGVAGTQYTWFAAIQRSNVAFATFVQYSAVAMTATWQILRRQLQPSAWRLLAVAAAIAGVALVAAGGSGGLVLTGTTRAGFALAFASAVGFTFYLLNSARLVQDIGPQTATAWGLTLGSVPMLAWTPPWTVHPTGNLITLAALTGVVAVGATALAFALSFASLRYLTPTEFAVTSTLEPALAAVAGAAFLGVTLRPAQYLGGALTIGAVLLLATAASRQP